MKNQEHQMLCNLTVLNSLLVSIFIVRYLYCCDTPTLHVLCMFYYLQIQIHIHASADYVVSYPALPLLISNPLAE